MNSKTEAPVSATPTPERPSEWVTQMHDHFGKTGTYRGEDLQRVLGDPRKSVGVPASNELASARPFWNLR